MYASNETQQPEIIPPDDNKPEADPPRTPNTGNPPTHLVRKSRPVGEAKRLKAVVKRDTQQASRKINRKKGATVSKQPQTERQTPITDFFYVNEKRKRPIPINTDIITSTPNTSLCASFEENPAKRPTVTCSTSTSPSSTVSYESAQSITEMATESDALQKIMDSIKRLEERQEAQHKEVTDLIGATSDQHEKSIVKLRKDLSAQRTEFTEYYQSLEVKVTHLDKVVNERISNVERAVGEEIDKFKMTLKDLQTQREGETGAPGLPPMERRIDQLEREMKKKKPNYYWAHWRR